MKNTRHCQSCHLPLTPADRGTERDGTPSEDYCIHCFQNGSFTNPFMTVEEMQQHVRMLMERQHEDERVIHYVLGTLPGLKRWEKHQQA